MADMTYENFVFFCKEFIAGVSTKTDVPDDLDAHADLLAAGTLDSHSFIDLLLAIEDKTGVFVDVSELDVDQVSSIHAIYHVISA